MTHLSEISAYARGGPTLMETLQGQRISPQLTFNLIQQHAATLRRFEEILCTKPVEACILKAEIEGDVMPLRWWILYVPALLRGQVDLCVECFTPNRGAFDVVATSLVVKRENFRASTIRYVLECRAMFSEETIHHYIAKGARSILQ